MLPERLVWPGSLKYAAVVLAFGVAYYLLGELGLRINSGYSGVTPFWPASGLSLLVFILLGPRYWPGIVIGTALLIYRLDVPLQVGLLVSCGQVLEALAAWYLVMRGRLKLEFRHVREVLHFSLISFSVPLISSLIGSTTMGVTGYVTVQDLVYVWMTWWLGSSVGILLIVPFFMVWRNLFYFCRSADRKARLDSDIIDDCRYILQPKRIGQFAIYALLLILICLYSFSWEANNASGKLALFYLILPLTVFVAISFEQIGATFASIIISAVLLFSYHPGWGLFFFETGVLSLLFVIIFICVTSITAMVVAALFTERRESEKELRTSHRRLQESELRLRQLSENINEVFWLVDARDDHVVYISPSCFDIWGRKPETFYSEPHLWYDSIHAEDQVRVFSEYEHFKRGAKFEIQYRIVRPDNTVRWIQDKGFPVYDESGRIYRLAGIAEDITEKKQTDEQKNHQEEERARLSRYISVGELGNSLAHEINQPLTSIMCYAKGGLNRAREGRLTDKDIQEVFSRLSDEAERAGRIINKLRDFVNRKDIKFSTVDINDLVQDSLRLVENKIKSSQVQVIYVLGKSLPLILVDSVLTQQVILNLVINAVESMDEVESERILTIMTEQQNEFVKVSFRDTGPGVSENMRENIFTPLVTTKKHGIGLGLPIANSIIESMGGELRAYPGAGPGYVFEFSLPIKQHHDRSKHAVSNWN